MSILADHYYRASLDNDRAWPALEESTRARVCVIGGGFAGLNTALGLAERGVGEVVLLEAERVGYGASGRNGGFVFGGFSRGEDALLRELGPARAKALYQGTLDAVELIRARIRRYGVDCDATEAGVIWANWFRDPEVLRARQRLLAEHFGVEWQWWPRERLRERVRSRRYHDALYEPQAFHFHPLKYAQGIAAQAQTLGVRVHEGSPALALERDGDGGGWRVRTPRGEVRAEQVVLACGGYLAGLRREVDAAVMPIATYVMVTQPLGELLDDALHTRAAIYDSRFAFDYYRPLRDGRLLWGGRISVRDRSPAQVQQLLYRDLLQVFPQLSGVRIDYAWSGLMSYARHQMPQVGPLGRIDEGLWLAQAFGGHGVAPTTFAGELLAAAIAHGDERWRELSGYGLVSAFKPAGLAAAQVSYAWAQFKDWFKDKSEGRD